MGIYYDAIAPSELENILNTYDFKSDDALMQTAKEAMTRIKKHHVSKYNNAPNLRDDFFKNDTKPKVLIVAQTSGDASLEYGLGNVFSTKQIIEDAIKENPNASIYIKLHPDVLVGKKSSDISIDEIPSTCTIVNKDVNPISLLKHFDKVYTKTSGMGMEALMIGLEVVCYGMPYYAGWGLTIDRQRCERRAKKLSVEELFAGAYILYTQYYNPYSQKKSNIIDTITTIIKYHDLTMGNNGDLYFFGFSRWKRKNTIPFFSPLGTNNIHF
jgi:capsular polysaccharide export protein